MSARQTAGLLLALAAIAAAALIGPIAIGSESGELPSPPPPAAPEPEVVQLARIALDQGLPGQISYRGQRYELERGAAGLSIICLKPTACALLSPNSDQVLVSGRPGARRWLRRQAEKARTLR